MRKLIAQFTLAGALLLSWSASSFAAAAPGTQRPRGPVRSLVANPNVQNRVHNAGKLWMNITNRGYFGNYGFEQNDAMTDPCPPGDIWAPQAEFPGGSGQQYLYQAALWVGALIDTGGFQTPRVSVGFDGWFSPNEMFPGEGVNDGILERSTRPGFSNCLGEPVHDPLAISDQDFISSYTDTLRDNFWVDNDEVDGPHRPLGIKVTQTSYSFSQAFAEDFILIDYEFENIASNFLKNVYVALYVDADIGVWNDFNHHIDDICGFDRYYFLYDDAGMPTDTIPIDVAYIADNDGREETMASGPFDVPHVAGTRVIRAPNPRLQTSFNWWVSHGDIPLDFGPSWEAYADRDSLDRGWTRDYGTPVGDLRKYQVMSNREFDYDQLDVCNVITPGVPPQFIPDNPRNPGGIFESWTNLGLAENAADICNGYDTRYLLSWGPLGIFEYQDAGGNDIYRLNPGEKFRMTIAYVAGENFHDVNNPQNGNQVIDRSKFNFSDLRANARWAREVYDNGMYDTPQFDWGNDHDPNTIDEDGSQGDGKLDTGDGWYGEDVGEDGLFAELEPGQDSVAVYYWRGTPWETFAGWYKGPDAGENDGRLTRTVNNPLHPQWTSEDHIIPDSMVYQFPLIAARYGKWDMGFMSGNHILDVGDGIPDFTGPPPPPIPALLRPVPNTYNAASHFGGTMRFGTYIGGLGYELKEETVLLRWSQNASEDTTYEDPFSRRQDFEGYRIHVGNTNLESAYSLIAQFDKCNFAYFSANDSMMSYPVLGRETGSAQMRTYACVEPEELPLDSNFGSPESPLWGRLQPVGLNTGFDMIKDFVHSTEGDTIYEFAINAHKLAPRYYAITAFDHGDPKSGLGPLTTRATTNAVLLAPAGTPREPVRVVPNPYRAYRDYTVKYGGPGGIGWENQNDGTSEFFAQTDRRLEFINLPPRCLIRIYTVAGDLVEIIPHNMDGDRGTWTSPTSEKWNLNSRNDQQVVSGIYLFSVEDRTDYNTTPVPEGGKPDKIQTGKFVIIR